MCCHGIIVNNKVMCCVYSVAIVTYSLESLPWLNHWYGNDMQCLISGIAVIVMMKEKLKVLEIHSR